MKLEMPPRQPEDGTVAVNRTGPNHDKISLIVEHSNCREVLTMSEYNAWRVFGMLGFMLGFMLGIPLTKEAGKAIKP